MKCSQEQAVYTRNNGDETLIVGVYVDDLIVIGTNVEGIKEFKHQMIKEFEMIDLGSLTYYLGIEVDQRKNCITLKQLAYAKQVMQQFKMAECNPTKYLMEAKLKLAKDTKGSLVNSTEYRCIIESLWYLTHTRSNLSYVVGMVSRYMEKTAMMHHQAVKHILYYVKRTTSSGLKYQRG
ncbi:uncharacterized protein LOC111430238 [Cucurbita moschata]|uniref:Uncharacterized protein LOC111430238 n=1 Tax=Cucurbita moschata TaxID=3662 RepID=A0A6J1E5U4_CUCMO|nr:uncharacterized protein LOC111430238 [Cucurbita moschata]